MRNHIATDKPWQSFSSQSPDREDILHNLLNIIDSDHFKPDQADKLRIPPNGQRRLTNVQAPFHIMIVDDDEINNYMLMRRIQTVDPTICISTAVNGHDAMGKLNQFILNSDIAFPHLLLVDLEMPICNGYEFLDLYTEEFFFFFPDTQLFVLTSSALDSDKKKAEAFPNVSRFITKPLPLSFIS